MRRIAIGHDNTGKAIITSDGELPAVDLPGIGTLYRAWSANKVATYPDAGQDPDEPGLFPPVGGMRVQFAEYAPGKRIESGGEQDRSGIDWEEGGMHVTDTTDVSVVLEGEIIIGTEGGVERKMSRGDTIVIAGARHYWRNDSDKPALLVYFMVGANRA